MSIRTLLADDEGPARRKMLRFLAAATDFEVVGEAEDGAQAIASIERLRPDVVFLDVQMPKMDGFAVAEALTAPAPDVVFVTAHDQFALRAFEVHAVDYLLKPFDEERFRKVLERVRERRSLASAGLVVERLQRLIADLQRPAERILIDEGERAFFLSAAEIDWVEAARNYVILHAAKKSHMLRATLDAFSKRLNKAEFVRVNRSAIVRIDAIRELQPWFHGEYKIVMKDGVTIPWTRRFITAEASRRLLG